MSREPKVYPVAVVGIDQAELLAYQVSLWRSSVNIHVVIGSWQERRPI